MSLHLTFFHSQQMAAAEQAREEEIAAQAADIADQVRLRQYASAFLQTVNIVGECMERWHLKCVATLAPNLASISMLCCDVSL
jgi:hypothetical protein